MKKVNRNKNKNKNKNRNKNKHNNTNENKHGMGNTLLKKQTTNKKKTDLIINHIKYLAQ